MKKQQKTQAYRNPTKWEFYSYNFDDLVKSQISIEFVIPAKAGIQLIQAVLDPGFRRGDDPSDFLRIHQFLMYSINSLASLTCSAASSIAISMRSL